jgi:excinuclease ABC subunit A
MKKEIIWFKNITTNNLKGFDIEVFKNQINCIMGPSGSGKSSLAFDTIYAISEHEYKLLLGDDEVYQYNVDDYSDLLIAIALKQSNYNINKRSTIATYYGLDSFFKYLFSSYHNISSELFSFNKFASACHECNGLGFIQVPDISTLIDYDLTLKEVPFRPWQNSSMKDYHKKIMHNICNDYDISLDVPFRLLKESDKEFLLNGTSMRKYKINFTQGNRKRVKTDNYYGIVKYTQTEIDKKNNDVNQYTRENICPICHGSRFAQRVEKYKIFGKSLGDIYLMEFTELKKWLFELRNENIKNVDSIIRFIENIIEMQLGYLFFNRSIPSLSGGEFQRLRLSQLLNTKFKNILFVFDEPLASLHIFEKDSIVDKISSMKDKNTLLLVEHDTRILPICDNIITLGPLGGTGGGFSLICEIYIG